LSSERYIVSLIKLLDDEDSFVARTAYEKLMCLDPSHAPLISKYRENANPRLKVLLDEVIDSLRYKGYIDAVVDYFKNDGEDFEQGAFLVAKFAYPDVNFKSYSEILDLMAVDLRKRLYTKEDTLDVIEAVNRFFFFEKGFRGNFENYYEPDNSYINRVIDRKIGIPITLSLVYILVGKRINLPVYGIGMPGHFIVKYESNGFEIFIDPFNGGRLMSRSECERLLSQLGYVPKDDYFRRATAKEVVKRMFGNLVLAYRNNGYVDKANKLIEIIKLVESFDENLHAHR
jgi:regulator of sirC expression with transglutaminase-like and TPR domain